MIRNHITTPALIIAGLLATSFTAPAQENSLTPYTNASEVPQTAVDLWKDYDPRKEDLEVRIHKEWKQDGVVSRLISFKVGTFKGSDSRIAAYYCFPDNGEKNPAFVWSHGGAQRAHRSRGQGFAAQGFATVDINWLGRPLETDLDPDNSWGTDWGKIDPSHGGGFYPRALRADWKSSFHPDEYSVDSILSPRNSNYFILALAGRRAITFLEQQPEVDPEKLGFAGFSMGGTITSMTAIDKRLKAVAPFVGGTANRYQNYAGMNSGGVIAGSAIDDIGDLNLYKNTIDPGAYWKHVTVPVMFISSSNDQHATLDRIYQSMDLLPHDSWRVSCNMHSQHRPGPEQWVMLDHWFRQYLAGDEQNIPATPPSTFRIVKNTAYFTLTPARQERLLDLEIYYSYSPNPITRFWKKAGASKEADTWKAELPVHPGLPLYTFALCRYALSEESRAYRGETRTFVLNSYEHSHIPGDIDLTAFDQLPKSGLIDDFSNGMANWGSLINQAGSTSFKFQDPELDTGPDNKLAITLDLKQGQELLIRLDVDGRYNAPDKEIGKFHYERKVSGKVPQTILLEVTDFKKGQNKNKSDRSLEWSKISIFTLTLTDDKTKEKINLAGPEGLGILKRIELIKP
ncbi:MAG: hypothetical protein GY790_12380 [Bacteroidetes bacterium]|nr:hypothetical protein [Bacteroidota bacterium]